MIALALTLALAQPLCDEEGRALLAEARARAEAFDLAGAAARAERAGTRGCAEGELTANYLRGLIAVREAARVGGSAESLAPVTRAIAALEMLARTEPRAAIAQAVLHAAAAASQSERDEMALYIEHAASLEVLQLAAGQPVAPGVAAHEVGGELWLQVHRYVDARMFLMRAAERLGATPRITLGLARAAARLDDTRAACDQYRALTRLFVGRPGEPPEIAEAKAYLTQAACAASQDAPRGQ